MTILFWKIVALLAVFIGGVVARDFWTQGSHVAAVAVSVGSFASFYSIVIKK